MLVSLNNHSGTGHEQVPVLRETAGSKELDVNKDDRKRELFFSSFILLQLKNECCKKDSEYHKWKAKYFFHSRNQHCAIIVVTQGCGVIINHLPYLSMSRERKMFAPPCSKINGGRIYNCSCEGFLSSDN